MTTAGQTRRQLLKALGVGAAGAVWAGSAPTTQSSPRIRTRRLTSFRLADVRLLEGPFLDAQRRDEKYLLQLEPDRLLHNFRRNAGLEPKAAIYGGWESQEPWVDIRCQGHSLGHYLSACALMFASTGDDRFKQRVDYVIDELAACQDAGGSGLICAFPDGATQLANSVGGKPFVGVPWYTMHKIYAGLRDAHVHAGNRPALTMVRRLTDWAWNATRSLTDDQLQRMLDREHGGMNEVLADVHVLTREPGYLELAQRFSHRALLLPLAEQRDVLDGLHSNTQIPKVIGFSRLYELTGRSEYRRASEYFWRIVVQHRSSSPAAMATASGSFRPLNFPNACTRQRRWRRAALTICCG